MEVLLHDPSHYGEALQLFKHLFGKQLKHVSIPVFEWPCERSQGVTVYFFLLVAKAYVAQVYSGLYLNLADM